MQRSRALVVAAAICIGWPRGGCAGLAFASASRVPLLSCRGHRALAFVSANGARSAAAREGVFVAGDVPLQSGAVFRDVRVAYEIHGAMNADKSNVILVSLASSAVILLRALSIRG